MNDFAFIDKLWADWSPGYTPKPDFMRGLKDTFATSIGHAISYYRDTFGGRATLDGDAAHVAAAASNAHGLPHLYMHGRDDGCLGLELIDEDELKRTVSEYELVEGAGHFLHIERPDVVNARIVDFLGRP
jgi:pimeloyl-ACP methyl ester carboxylesterase